MTEGMLDRLTYGIAVVGVGLTTADLRAGVGLRSAPRQSQVIGDAAGDDREWAGRGVVLCAHQTREGARSDEEGRIEHADAFCVRG
jgi:hypothetical protein